MLLPSSVVSVVVVSVPVPSVVSVVVVVSVSVPVPSVVSVVVVVVSVSVPIYSESDEFIVVSV